MSTGDEQAIDWAALHRRLEAVRQAIDHGEALTPEAQREILRARARALAEPPPATGAAEAGLEILEFSLAQETYGIESAYVREVYPLRDLTPVPCTPRFVLGLVNVRGQILTVVDIKRFFGLPDRGLTELNKIIILQSADMQVGILADALLGIRRVALQAVQAPLPTLTGAREKFLRGITAERAAILDAGKLLADPGLVVHEEVEA